MKILSINVVGNNFEVFMILMIVLAIISTGILMTFFIDENKRGMIVSAIILCVSLICSIIFYGFCEDHYEYKALLNEGTKIESILNDFDLISQDGEIYIFKEKNK